MRTKRATTVGGAASGLRWVWPGAGAGVMTSRGLVAASLSGARPETQLATGRTTMLEGGTTNLVPNPAFGVGVARWFLNGAGTQSRTRLTSDGALGSTCAEVSVDGSVGGQGLISDYGAGLRIPVVGGATYAFSAWARQMSGHTAMIVGADWYNAGGGYVSSSSTTMTRQSTWTRHVLVLTAPGTAASVTLQLRQSAASAGVYRISNVQLEAGTRAGSYCDGTLGTGFAWTGTAHDSASTREASLVQLPATGWSASTGGCVLSVTPAWAGADTQEHVLLHWRADASRELRLAFDGSGDWLLEWVDSGVSSVVSRPATHAAGDIVTLVARWSPAALSLAVDGVGAMAARAGAPGSMADAPWVTVGRRADAATGYADGLVGAVGYARTLRHSVDVVAPGLGRSLRWGDFAG